MKLYPIYQVAETMDIQLTKELLEALIQDESIYPWNPYSEESEAYFQELEDHMCLSDCWTLEELETNTDSFFSSLEKCWQLSKVEAVRQYLDEQLNNKVPSIWIENIVNRAQDIFSSNLAPIDQLVQCVKPFLSGWEDDDLRVFARPLAYAMRGNNIPTMDQLMSKDSWDELSQIEQIRLSMAIAQYTINQLSVNSDHLSVTS